MVFEDQHASAGQAVDDWMANGGAKGCRVHTRRLVEGSADGLTRSAIEFLAVENVRRLGDGTAKRVAVNHHLVDVLILFAAVRLVIGLV